MSAMQLSSMIVDDVSSSRKKIRDLLRKHCPEVAIIHLAGNVKEASQIIDSEMIDVVFLDIQMPGGNGFELIEKFQDRNFQVVFVTGYVDYCLRAIKINALDYLVKPIDVSELQIAVSRLVSIKKEEKSVEVMQRSLASFQEQVHHRKKAEHITLHHLGGFDIVSIKDILYLKAESNYTAFLMKDNRKILVCKTIKVFDELLRDFDFIRIHKSYLVNFYCIQQYKHEDIGWVIMSNGDRLEVSRRRNANFMATINTLKITNS